MPDMPTPATPVARKIASAADREYALAFADRRLSAFAGSTKHASYDCLKVNVLASRGAAHGNADDGVLRRRSTWTRSICTRHNTRDVR